MLLDYLGDGVYSLEDITTYVEEENAKAIVYKRRRIARFAERETTAPLYKRRRIARFAEQEESLQYDSLCMQLLKAPVYPRVRNSIEYYINSLTRYMKNNEEKLKNNRTVLECLPCRTVSCSLYDVCSHYLYHLELDQDFSKKNEGKFSCCYCKNKFRNISSRCQHMRKHTKEPGYICEECGNDYIYKDSYIRHKCKIK